VKRSLGFGAWHGVVSVVVAAALGVVVNLVTDGFTWTLAAVVLGLVAGQAALSLWQGRHDQRDRRDARDELLGPLRLAVPDLPDGPLSSELGLVFRLTAPYSPTPLWGRSADRDRLVAWCLDRDAGVARVITGSAGVGKSRLALAVAEALPAGWAAGRLLAVDSLVERIAACGEPTLVVVEDADRVADLDVLLTRAARHPDLVRLVLLTRDATALRSLPDTVLPHLVEVRLTPIGTPSDRERWFAEAVRAYAKTLGVPPPDLPARTVGDDDDTLLLLHARALLAVLGRARSRDWSLRELAAELLVLEQRSWEHDLARLPSGCDVDVLAEVVTVLALTPARTAAEAADLLRRVPQFAHDSSHESRTSLARWARGHYPPGPDGLAAPRPHVVAERLVVDTLARTPELFHDDTAVAPLARAYRSFPDALDPLVTVLTTTPERTPARLAALFATGVAGDDLDRALATRLPAIAETLPGLVVMPVPAAFPHLGCAFGFLAVNSIRLALVEVGTREAPALFELAAALDGLGSRLAELGRYPEASTVQEEAVEVLRDLARAEPDRYGRDLAAVLTRRGLTVRALGDHDAALAALEEADTLLPEADDGVSASDRVLALGNKALALRDAERPTEALAASTEAVALGRSLDGVDRRRFAMALATHGLCLITAGRHREGVDALAEAAPILHERTGPSLEFAVAAKNLGFGLWRLGRHEEALGATGMAVRTLVDLAVDEPDRHDPELSLALNNHAGVLRDLGRPAEAAEATLLSVAVQRRLAKAGWGDHRAGLGTALGTHATSLLAVGRPTEALPVFEEAVAVWRDLVATAPRPPRVELASLLINLAIVHWTAGDRRQAFATITESVESFRDLVAADPAGAGPLLAHALTNLAGFLQASGRNPEAEEALRECVAVWQACAAREPDLHGPSYAAARTRLRALTG